MSKERLLSDLGEDRLVRRLLRGVPSGERLLVGPGDDCAVVGTRNERVWTLLKCDCVIEGVHFVTKQRSDFARVGWKALARAVSDVAAMGGVPREALVTVAFPPALPLAHAEALYAGLRKCARAFGVVIAGGETARSPSVAGMAGPLFLSVALTGTVERGRCVTRAGGRPGDALFVTGRLGGSFRSGRHWNFLPRVEEARWLTRHFRLRAMIDLSDGLGSDLPRLAAASGCGFELGEVPLHPGCTRAEALSDGEDYELLFALSPRSAARLQKSWPFKKVPLTHVGRLTAGPLQPLSDHGYDHFA